MRREKATAILLRATELIEYDGFAAMYEAGSGTNRPFYACRQMSAHGGKAVVQPAFGSIHRTCLSPLVTDRAMEAWYHPSIA